MAKVEKVAISVQADILQEAEQLRAKTGESRSALFARAVKALLDRESHAQRVQKYVRGYAERPEIESEVWQDVARATLASQDW